MFQAEKIQRDKYGFWLHSALEPLEEHQPITDLPAAEGMEFRYIAFVDNAPEDLQEIYENGSGDFYDAVRKWEPTVEGDGWFLVSLCDTEDGPFACFARPQPLLETPARKG